MFRRSIAVFGGLLGLVAAWWVQPAVSLKAGESFGDPDDSRVVLQTTAGDIVLRVWSSEVPISAAAFLENVARGLYDDTTIHMARGGMLYAGVFHPDGTLKFSGYASPRRTQAHECPPTAAGRFGVLCYSSTVAESKELFFCLNRLAWLEGHATVLGKVEEGLEILSAIAEGADEDGRPAETVTILGAEIL